MCALLVKEQGMEHMLRRLSQVHCGLASRRLRLNLPRTKPAGNRERENSICKGEQFDKGVRPYFRDSVHSRVSVSLPLNHFSLKYPPSR